MLVDKQRRTEIRKVILDHVGRYRMSTKKIMGGLPELRTRRRELRQVLAQMCDSGELGTEALFRNQNYYFLAQERAESDGRVGPLSELAKIRSYAMLAFCCQSESPRERLTPEEMYKNFPELFCSGMAQSYYLDRSVAQPRLGFLRVDTGGRGRWDRIVNKVRADWEDHWAKAEWRPLIDRGEFEITLITALRQKAERIHTSLMSWSESKSSRIRIGVCPELLNLIAPPPC